MSTGSIRARSDGIWQLRWEIRSVDGRRKYFSATIHGRKAVAEAALRKHFSKVDNGSFVEPTRTTVADFCGRWIRNYAETNVRRRITEGYCGIIRREIVPAFGGVDLQAFTANHIRARHDADVVNALDGNIPTLRSSRHVGSGQQTNLSTIWLGSCRT